MLSTLRKEALIVTWTESAVEYALEALGVDIVGASGDEIQAYCPVHHLTRAAGPSRTPAST